MYKYNLLRFLPQYYKASAVMADVLQPMEAELQRLLAAVEAAKRQVNVQTATGAGLARHEEEVGITPNPSDSDDERRARVIAKKNGTRTITEDTLKRIVSLYVDGDIDVTENSAASIVTVDFETHVGVPTNINELKAAINEVIPAHLMVVYIYNYRAWNEYTAKKWNELTSYTWEQLKTREGEI